MVCIAKHVEKHQQEIVPFESNFLPSVIIHFKTCWNQNFNILISYVIYESSRERTRAVFSIIVALHFPVWPDERGRSK